MEKWSEPRACIQRGVVGAANLHITSSGRANEPTYSDESPWPRACIKQGVVGFANLHKTSSRRGRHLTYNED